MKVRIKSQSKIYYLETEKDTISIGRSSENDLVIPLDDFSRHHCVVTNKGDYYFIQDSGSKNGVKLNGTRIRPNEQYPIYANTKILIANYFECIIFDDANFSNEDESQKIILEKVLLRK